MTKQNVELNNFSYGEFEIEKVSVTKLKIGEREKSLKGIGKDNSQYLTDIIDIEKPIWGTNNMIYSPVGSGKTTLMNKLFREELPVNGKALILGSTSNLIKDICPQDDLARQANYEAGKSFNMCTSKNKKIYGDGSYSVLVMTYAEFGYRMEQSNEGEFAKQFDIICSDEIHSLPDFREIDKASTLTHAIKYLFDKHNNQTLFYFTATDDYLIKMEKRKPGTLRNVTIFEYRDYSNIKRYTSEKEIIIHHKDDITQIIRDNKDRINNGMKVFIYTDLIESQLSLADQVNQVDPNIKTMCLWSVNSKKDMDVEQMEFYEEILRTGIYPKGYQVLIINAAMKEGWNLYDKDIQLSIMNSSDKTRIIQADGRIRHDKEILVYRSSKFVDVVDNILLPREFLNIPLTGDKKRDMCEELDYRDKTGRTMLWTSIKKILLKSGYDIVSSKKTIDGKRIRVETIINIEENNEKIKMAEALEEYEEETKLMEQAQPTKQTETKEDIDLENMTKTDLEKYKYNKRKEAYEARRDNNDTSIKRAKKAQPTKMAKEDEDDLLAYIAAHTAL